MVEEWFEKLLEMEDTEDPEFNVCLFEANVSDRQFWDNLARLFDFVSVLGVVGGVGGLGERVPVLPSTESGDFVDLLKEENVFIEIFNKKV